MNFVPGTKCYVEIIVNNSFVYENNSNHLYCFSLSNITGDLFWLNISTTFNIGVVDAVNNIECKKSTLGFIDIVGRKGVLYWCGAISSNSKFYICVGKGINCADSNLCFSNAGVLQIYPCCEQNGSTVLNGAFSNANKTSGYCSFNSGLIYRSIKATYNTLCFKDTTSYCGVNNRTIFFIYRIAFFWYSNMVLLLDNSLKIQNSNSYNGKNNTFQATTGITLGSAANNAVTLGSYGTFAMSYNTTGITNFYINGLQSGNQNLNLGTPQSGGTVNLFSSNGSYGVIDQDYEQIIIDNSVLSSNRIKTRNAMMLDNTTFFGNNFNTHEVKSINKNRVNLRLGIGI